MKQMKGELANWLVVALFTASVKCGSGDVS